MQSKKRPTRDPLTEDSSQGARGQVQKTKSCNDTGASKSKEAFAHKPTVEP
jgi:hypothetical protein